MARSRVLLALILGLAVGLSAGLLSTSLADPSTPAATRSPSRLQGGTFAALAETVKPAVVNVSAQRVASARTPLEELYGAPDQMPRRSLGSGVIIDPAGVALTNAHVVDNAAQIEVVMVDGTKHPAKLIGLDKKTDLAVLKLESPTGAFPYLPLGDSNETRVGDWVIAVGSPFGLHATVTSGIISAKARQIGAGPFDEFLQTDAAINPGNSGGPLVNMQGEVVGINTAIVRNGAGIGFAIPSSLAKRISAELLATGKVTRGWLGVSLQPLTPASAASLGVKDKAVKGALVSEVVPGSPAAQAGLKAGDIVVAMDGTKVREPADLARLVGHAKPGHQSKLEVWREGRAQTIEVRLAQEPGPRRALSPA